MATAGQPVQLTDPTPPSVGYPSTLTSNAGPVRRQLTADAWRPTSGGGASCHRDDGHLAAPSACGTEVNVRQGASPCVQRSAARHRR